MERPQFDFQIARLKREWKNAYGDEKIGMFWDDFHLVSIDVFKDCVNQLIKEEKFAPPYAKFVEKLGYEVDKAKTASMQASVNNVDDCYTCKNKGEVVYVAPIVKGVFTYRNHVYMCRCECDRGKKLYPGFMTANQCQAWIRRENEKYDREMKRLGGKS